MIYLQNPQNKGNLLKFLISANCVGSTDKAKSLQKGRKQFASRRKRYLTLEPGSFLCYKSIDILN